MTLILSLVAMFATTNATNANHSAHTPRHTRTAAVVPANTGTILHDHTSYRAVRTWCEAAPGRCVRVGNTYIVQGR